MKKIKEIFVRILRFLRKAVRKPRLVITYDDDTQFFLIVSNRPKLKVEYVTKQQLFEYVDFLLKEEK